jgi:hypothetical protein
MMGTPASSRNDPAIRDFPTNRHVEREEVHLAIPSAAPGNTFLIYGQNEIRYGGDEFVVTLYFEGFLARSDGFEPPTLRFEVSFYCSKIKEIEKQKRLTL